MNGTIQPSFSLSAKNDAGAPDAISITVDAVMDSAKGYPYSINFFEE